MPATGQHCAIKRVNAAEPRPALFVPNIPANKSPAVIREPRAAIREPRPSIRQPAGKSRRQRAVIR